MWSGRRMEIVEGLSSVDAAIACVRVFDGTLATGT
jgi:hypothetical protein